MTIISVVQDIDVNDSLSVLAQQTHGKENSIDTHKLTNQTDKLNLK